MYGVRSLVRLDLSARYSPESRVSLSKICIQFLHFEQSFYFLMSKIIELDLRFPMSKS